MNTFFHDFFETEKQTFKLKPVFDSMIAISSINCRALSRFCVAHPCDMDPKTRQTAKVRTKVYPCQTNQAPKQTQPKNEHNTEHNYQLSSFQFPESGVSFSREHNNRIAWPYFETSELSVFTQS